MDDLESEKDVGRVEFMSNKMQQEHRKEQEEDTGICRRNIRYIAKRPSAYSCVFLFFPSLFLLTQDMLYYVMKCKVMLCSDRLCEF